MTRQKRRARSRARNQQMSRRAAARRQKRDEDARVPAPKKRRERGRTRYPAHARPRPTYSLRPHTARYLRRLREGTLDLSRCRSSILPTLLLLCERTSAERLDRLQDLLRMADRRLPMLSSVTGVRWLCALTREAWLQPLSGFRPRGTTGTARCCSLLRWLLVRYPVPPALLTEVAELAATGPLKVDLLERRVPLLARLGRGDSLRQARRDGLLPAALSRRMLHRLSSLSAPSLVAAMRRLQVEAFGGPPALAERIEASFLKDAQPDSRFWESVIQWLCSQEGLPLDTVRPLLDYIRHRHLQPVRSDDPSAVFSIHGRTLDALLTRMQDWHRHLRQNEPVRYRSMWDRATYRPSGFLGGEVSLGARSLHVTEVLTRDDLHAEGAQMRHCVFSYRHRVAQGRVSIWSVTCGGMRALTVEVDNATRCIVQIRGHRNRRPDNLELAILQLWADKAGLRLMRSASL